MTALPNAAAAIVEEIKARGYLLSAEHPQNGGKAAFFRAFGFNPKAWATMRDALLAHPVANRVAATKVSPHGAKCEVRCSSARRTDEVLALPRFGCWKAAARLAWSRRILDASMTPAAAATLRRRSTAIGARARHPAAASLKAT